MRALVFLLVAAGVLASGSNDVPNEQQMRGALEAALKTYVRNALEFAAESGGPQAVERVRQAGTDRFDIRAFEKRDCAWVATERSFLCGFAVDIDLSDGMLRRTLSGRFSTTKN